MPGLSSQLIRSAYEHGFFPMGDENGEVWWYQPFDRALFPIEGIHVSRSFARVLKRVKISDPSDVDGDVFAVTFDRAFEDVMRGCLRPQDNWITEEIIEGFCAVHAEGWAHSCEVWLDGRLVGGTYGVALGSCFSAESMFHRVTDASKVALWAMVNRCRELGFTLFDAQIMNPHLKTLGAFELPQAEYLQSLNVAMRQEIPWSPEYYSN